MPRAFSEREKDIIQSDLRAAGRELFANFGLRKTNVEDLTRAAGISKGAFYLFYDSKEALYLEIIEDYEQEFRARIFANIQRAEFTPRENFKALLREGFQMWREHPMLRHFNQEDFQALLRRLPEASVQSHFQHDEAAMAGLLEMWRVMGVTTQVDAPLLTDLMKSLFFISLHETEIGPGYPRALDVLIDLIAGYVFCVRGEVGDITAYKWDEHS